MGLRINTNLFAIPAQRNLSRTGERLAVNYRRLSSGLRIASAADDAAGQSIAERLRAQSRSVEQSVRNANDGISMVQTAEGGLNEISNLLVRLRELAVQSSNGTNSGDDQDTLDSEFQSLVSEIDRIAQATIFNEINVLNSSASVDLQVGTNTTAGVDTISVTLEQMRANDLGVSGLDIGNGGDPSAAITAIDTAINTVNDYRSTLGGLQNRLASTIANLEIRLENTKAAESRIRDVDVASETADLVRNSIMQQAAVAILAQANAQPNLALALLG